MLTCRAPAEAASGIGEMLGVLARAFLSDTERSAVACCIEAAQLVLKEGEWPQEWAWLNRVKLQRSTSRSSTALGQQPCVALTRSDGPRAAPGGGGAAAGRRGGRHSGAGRGGTVPGGRRRGLGWTGGAGRR